MADDTGGFTLVAEPKKAPPADEDGTGGFRVTAEPKKNKNPLSKYVSDEQYDKSKETAEGLAGGAIAGKGVKEIPGLLKGAGTLAEKALPLVNKGATAAGKVLRGGSEAVEDIIKNRLEGAERTKADKIKNAAPTRTDLQALSEDAFRDAEKAGANVKPEAFGEFTKTVPATLKAEKITSGSIPMSEKIYPHTKDMVDRLEDYQGHELTLDNLQTLQQEANGFVKKALIAAEGDRSAQDVRGTSIVAKRIKDFVQNLKPEQVASGDPAKAIPALNKAKELWRRNAKMDTIENIVDVAKKLKDPVYLQNQFRAIVKDQLEYKNFTAKEQKLIDEIAGTHKGEAVVDVVAPHRGRRMVEAVRGVDTGRLKKAQELMDMIARGEEAQKVAPGPSFMDTINSVMRPGPPNSANRRLP